MAEPRGVFSLSRVFTRRRRGTWVDVGDAYTQEPPVPIGYDTGYFASGSPESSTLFKLSYTTETSSTSSNLTAVHGAGAAIGNATHGYFGGGNPGPKTSIDKFTYSSETSALTTGNLSVARYLLSAIGNSGSGYFSGGYGAPTHSTTDKLTYSTDTSSTVAPLALSAAKYSSMGIGNETAGYQVSGQSPSGQYTTTDKISYSTETLAAVPGAATSVVRNSGTGVGNNAAGYFSGGGPGRASSTDKLTYSTETTALLPSGADSSQNRSDVAAGGSNSSSGYILGGRNPSGTISIADKINFSNDTLAYLPGANLPSAAKYFASASSRSNALPTTQANPITNLNGVVSGPNIGYRYGGDSPKKSFTDKVNYTTDTTSRVPGGSDVVERRHQGTSNTTTRGYVFGGDTPGSPTQISTASRMTYSSETMAQIPGAALTTTRTNPTGKGNNNQGYMSGGRNPNTSSTDKCTYSTETTARVPGADISSPRWGAAAVGNQELQYILGGRNPAISPTPSSYGSMIQKMSFSSETMSTISDTLSAARYLTSGTSSNKNAGYLCGGYTPAGPLVTTTDRITFATDAVAEVPSAALTGTRYGSAGAGNNSAGYIMGGNVSFPNPTSYVDKLDYATETTSASSNLPENILYSAATSSRDNDLPFQAAATLTNSFSDTSTAPNTGYFGGGYNPALSPTRVSNFSKLDFSTEVTTALPGADFATGRGGPRATGDTSAGYFAGGALPSGRTTQVDKLTYSSDTRAALPTAGSISQERSSGAAAGNVTAGYFVSGTMFPNPPATTTDKITYSTETTAAVPGAAVATGRLDMFAAGNLTSGYFAGGRNPALSPTYVSTMDRITYSSDTTAQVPGASLSGARYGPSAAGTLDVGYFAGGYTSSYISTIDKLAYSTETLFSVPGKLSIAKAHAGATGNSSSGYWVGGKTSTEPATTRSEKITYSTDTTSVVPSTFNSYVVWDPGAASARENAVAATTNIV